jgi:hypothetical protein
MNHLRKLGLASFFFLGLGFLSGALALQLDPATDVTITVICYAIGLILALIAFMQSRRGQSLDRTTKFLARAPLALITIGVLIFFLRAMPDCRLLRARPPIGSLAEMA